MLSKQACSCLLLAEIHLDVRRQSILQQQQQQQRQRFLELPPSMTSTIASNNSYLGFLKCGVRMSRRYIACPWNSYSILTFTSIYILDFFLRYFPLSHYYSHIPTDPFTTSEFQNLPRDVPELRNIRRSPPDFKALKLWKGQLVYDGPDDVSGCPRKKIHDRWCPNRSNVVELQYLCLWIYCTYLNFGNVPGFFCIPVFICATARQNLIN